MIAENRNLFCHMLRGALAAACEYSQIVLGDDDFLTRRIGDVLEIEIDGLRYAGTDSQQLFIIREGRPAMSVESALWRCVAARRPGEDIASWFFEEKAAWIEQKVTAAFERTIEDDMEALRRARAIAGTAARRMGCSFVEAGDTAAGSFAAIEEIIPQRPASSARGYYLSGGPTMQAWELWRRLEDVSEEAGRAGWMIGRQLLRNGMEKLRVGCGVAIVVERSGESSPRGEATLSAVTDWAAEKKFLCLGLNRNRMPLRTLTPRPIANAYDQRPAGLSDDPRFIIRERFWEELLRTNFGQRRDAMQAMLGAHKENLRTREP